MGLIEARDKQTSCCNPFSITPITHGRKNGLRFDHVLSLSQALKEICKVMDRDRLKMFEGEEEFEIFCCFSPYKSRLCLA